MSERLILPLIIAGAVLLLIGWVWLVAQAIQTGFLRKAIFPAIVILLGIALIVTGPVYNRLYPPPVDTKVKVDDVKTETGEVVQELTGTGADTKDLQQKMAAGKHFAVIQIANKNFTDDELAVLTTMEKLTFLDINDNPVTDTLLEQLVKLPKLTKLFAARTKFTADGVKKFVLDNPDCKLTEIDFRGLVPPVSGKLLREWQAKDPARKFNN
jgi:hypothetical protein